MIDYAIYTDTGGREINEDSVRAEIKDDSSACFVVADGLGGHGRGEVASACVAEHIAGLYRSSGASQAEFVADALASAQNELLAEQLRLSGVFEMKTTAVVLRVRGSSAEWGHVGDSRLYFFGKGRLRQMTMDHSVPRMLQLAGQISEKEIRRHPDRNRLLRVMGIKWDEPKYELGRAEITRGCAFLLCTDGFWELISEKEMSKALKKSSCAEEWLKKMSELVRQRGKNEEMDNNTAVAVVFS